MKNKNSCTPSYPKKIFMHLPEKIHLREMLKKDSCCSKPPHPPHNFSNGPSLRSLSRKNSERWVWGRFEREGTILSPVSLPCIFSRFLTLLSERFEQVRVFDVPMSHKLETFRKISSIFLKMRSGGCMHSWGPTPPFPPRGSSHDSCQEPLPLFKEVLTGLVALTVDGLIKELLTVDGY